MSGNSTLTQEELIAVIVTPSVGGTLIIAVTVGLCIWWFKCRTRPEEEKNTSNHIVLHDRGPPTAPFDDEPICDSFRHTRAPTRKPIYDSSIDPQGYYENSHFHNPAAQPSNGFVKPPQYPQNDENIRYNPLFEHYPTRTREANPNLWNYQEPSDVDGRAAVTSVSRELQDNPSPSRLPRYDPSMPSQPQELRSNPYQQATQSYPSQQATQSYPSQQATQSYPYQQATQSYPYQQATKRSEDPSRKEVASYAKPVYYYDDTLRVDDVQWNPMRMNWTEKKEFQGKLSIPRASKKITY